MKIKKNYQFSILFAKIKKKKVVIFKYILRKF